MSSPALDSEDLSRLSPSPLTFPVVGIGGSAGGLQAVIRFLEHMPPDSGMAFVVILHLSRDHESDAAQIFQRATKMPVAQVTSSVRVEADHVYVIAPRAELLMNDGHLQLGSTERTIGPAVAIDVFFRTLAQVHRNHAFCVVMSGTGSDGAVGLMRVKERGGITIAQLPGDAEHDDMPRAAIATGLVDFILPAAEIGAKLVELWANAREIHLPTVEESLLVSTPDGEAAGEGAEAVLQEIMALLRVNTRHDFKHYKRGTVVRRIERRLQVNGLRDLASYRDFLRSDPREAWPLLQDMLISVTNFFRDHSAFEAIEQEVIPRILQARNPGEQARIWVAGCATGEESYSLSILMQEQLAGSPSHADVQIFATDIDDRAIATARRGVYPSGIAADVSEARLKRFFIEEQGRYRVSGAVREQVLFAAHNLLRDPPFSRLDLVCCRNLLIYLDQSAQASVLEMFRYALKPGGYLFLGTSESADAADRLFTPVDKKNRIYRVNGSVRTRGHAAYIAGRTADYVASKPASALPEPERKQHQPAASELAHLQALQRVSPASVLVDEKFDVLHLSPTAGRFMQRGGGVPSHNLLNNVDPGLRLELRTALFNASQTGTTVHALVAHTTGDGKPVVLEIIVHPLTNDDPLAARTLVSFREVADGDGEEANARAPAANDPTHHLMLAKLEEENRHLKMLLQNTLERSALSNEELKASNEELQAINEELRSATEELETSKEELQSINEELGTVNFELRTKVEERGQINDDLQNLISSSEIATVFVDSGMRIKRFTPQASKLFSLIASDIGRSLLDITNRLNYGELAADAAAVFKDLRIVERQMTTTDDRRFFARILPYRTSADKIEGAVLTFFDVTELKLAEGQVRASEERLRLAAASTSDFAIITTDEQGAITTWNIGAERIFGYQFDEMEGHSISEIFMAQDRLNGLPQAEMKLALETGRAENEGWRQRKDGSTFYCSGVLSRLQGDAGRGFVKIARDMTGSKRQELAQENLLLKEQQVNEDSRRVAELKDRFLAVMSHELKQPLNVIQVSAELLTRLPETKGIVAAVRLGTTIQRAVRSQSKIINDLLDLSRIQTGKLGLDVALVDVSELVRSMALAAKADFAAKGVELEARIEENIVFHGDHVRAEQMVWNLVGNALKFTPPGGRVVIDLRSDASFLKVSVTDTGCGISADFLPQVFDMFKQETSDAAPLNGGLGIGLTLVRELAEAHGGHVEAWSAGVGEGATFSVSLPQGSQPSRVVPEHGGASLDQLARMRILVLDDDAESLAAFSELLRLEGATVRTAALSTEALDWLMTSACDLIVSDVSMPEMDGMAFIAEVTRRLGTRKPMAIAMSGYGRPVDALRALEAGFDAHLPKPASVAQLKSVLAEIVSRRAGARKLPEQPA